MYIPGTLPSNPADVPGFLLRELQKIQAELGSPQNVLRLTTLYAEPAKPREGDIAKADGASWNPGSGAGAYIYRGGAWHFLG